MKRRNSRWHFLKDGKFQCNSCGACCRFITPLVAKGRLPNDWLNKDGSCTNLIVDQEKSNELLELKYKCKIYDQRPSVCRVDVELKPNYSDNQIAKMCKVLKDFVDKV